MTDSSRSVAEGPHKTRKESPRIGDFSLLLLHGVGLRAEFWGAQIDGLKDRYPIIAPDLPGHGDAAPLDKTCPDLDDYVESCRRYIDRPVAIIGHSMGAMIGAELAAICTEHVRAFVSLNAVHRRDCQAKAAVLARAEGLAQSERIDPGPTLQRWFDDRKSAAAKACEGWLRNADPKGYAAAYRVFAQSDGPDDKTLEGINAPCLFITGECDPNSTPQMSQAMAARVRQGSSLTIEGAGHIMPLTHADELNAALACFLRDYTQ
ncbi:alpha/beta fold hydrolase [Thioalkalivibrio sp. HK1]|uniref:alpha/beta fold hydrolase n=1 Tax=Thioalkalivibrio sp. HK1 TaxID=1469245 RepID=UPI00046EC8C9|nr:alpha/beta hydrolase [Thioalkalivibrio sp. HK1]